MLLVEGSGIHIRQFGEGTDEQHHTTLLLVVGGLLEEGCHHILLVLDAHNQKLQSVDDLLCGSIKESLYERSQELRQDMLHRDGLVGVLMAFLHHLDDQILDGRLLVAVQRLRRHQRTQESHGSTIDIILVGCSLQYMYIIDVPSLCLGGESDSWECGC